MSLNTTVGPSKKQIAWVVFLALVYILQNGVMMLFGPSSIQFLGGTFLIELVLFTLICRWKTKGDRLRLFVGIVATLGVFSALQTLMGGIFAWMARPSIVELDSL